MPKKIPVQLLKLLSDGDYHSGEAIGDVLGVSRAAVWKQLQKLEEIGLNVDSVKGRGYCLSEPLILLDSHKINAAAEQRGLCGKALVYLDIDSTNAQLLKLLAAVEASSGDVVVAEMQAAGRGRRGREWSSPFGSNIYYSMCWSFEGGAAALEGLSLVVGLALIEVLEGFNLQGLGLKWPNDVLVGKRKLAGILLEITGDPNGLCHVVIGIGLNVNMSGSAGEISQPWTSLSLQAGRLVDRNDLVIELTTVLQSKLSQFAEGGFSAFEAEWARLDAFIGKDVVITQGQNKRFGRAAGVNSKGEFLLEVEGQLHAFNGGEVSLRLVV